MPRVSSLPSISGPSLTPPLFLVSWPPPVNEAKMYSLLVFSSQTLCSQLSFTSQDRPVPIQKVTEKVSPEVPDGGAVSALMGLDGFLVCDSKERYSMSLAVKLQIRFAFINLVALRHLV